MHQNNHVKQFENALVQWFRDSAFRTVVTIVVGRGASRADAEDIAAEAVCRAWECQNHLRDETKIHPWIKRIAINALIDHQRRRRFCELIADGCDVAVPPDVNLAAIDVEIALARCSERQRSLLRLVYIEQQPIREVAQKLSISVQTLTARLARARRAVRRSLERAV